MRLIKLFLISCSIIIGSNNLARPQNQVDSKQAIQMIREFYIAYNTVWSARLSPQILNQKLDSLKMKYCAITLMVELKGDIDHDVLINDQYTDIQHLKTLTVSKDESKTNSYSVSYTAPTTNPLNKPIEEKVVIHLTVMKGTRGIVIDSVDE
jgi:hypothetical protein